MATLEAALERVHKYALAQLVRKAGVGHPGCATEGASWLTGLAETFVADVEIQGAAMLDDDDFVTDMVEGEIPVYDHDLWQVWLDLALYHEDLSDHGIEDLPEDIADLARLVIRGVACRLAETLRAEVREAIEDEEEDEED